ncbi:MAG: hypothetical protein JKY80_04075, partial [Mariprofundaceae bacterium]|nr:hypothetical protein [Mariprofundaceae bacterium]
LRIAQEQVLEFKRVEQKAEIAKTREYKEQEEREAQISKEQAIEVAEILKSRDVESREIEKRTILEQARIQQQRDIEVAEQDKQIAVAEKSEAESAARAQAAGAEKIRVEKEEAVITAREVAEANRRKEIEVIDAKKEAERDAVGIIVQADAEKRAAQDKATAVLTEAKATADAKKLKAEADEKIYAVEAAGKKALYEAENTLRDEQIELQKSLAILKRLDKLFARMRQSMSSVWIFHEQALDGANSIGSWLAVREVTSGSRGLMKRFDLTGIRQLVLFRKDSETLDTESLVDTHHLVRDLKVDGMMISEAGLSPRLQSVYSDSMAMSVLNSASVTARMLYQMHHCAWMPELGIRMLDAVSGEIGLKTVPWAFEVQAGSGMATVLVGKKQQALDIWLSDCFASGVNLLAARREDGSFVLFSDLMQAEKNEVFNDVVGLGGSTLLWSGMMESALSMAADQPHENVLKQFTWPETWDLSMIFLGWHAGLPAMIEEMAFKHHKLTVHVLSTVHEDKLTLQNRRVKDACERAALHCKCELKVSLHAWDGLDTEVWESLLRGCKVMMFYPEEQANGSEDSLLELWFHEVARVLSERKAKVKWWTPPKLMVLPRSGEHVSTFEMAGLDYPDLAVDVGSPDAFHDVFMARQLLTHARKHLNQQESLQDEKSYAFMDAMLGDAVLVEDVASTRLLEVEAGMDWLPVYREALRRGWMLMAYVMPEIEHRGQTAFTVLDKMFPQPQDNTGSRMHLLAGSPVMEMDVPAQTVTLLFCRRGVLNVNDAEEELVETAVKEVVTEKLVEEKSELIEPEVVEEEAEEVVQEVSNEAEESIEHERVDDIKQAEIGLEKAVLEGEVMNDSVWPQQADKRLLRVLKKQVGGSLELLNESCEEGLVKLTEVLDMGVSEEVEELIMAALTDLQNIDRVSQRLNNVKSCLKDWSDHVPEASAAALWEEDVSKRYVMEEERMVLKEEL